MDAFVGIWLVRIVTWSSIFQASKGRHQACLSVLNNTRMVEANAPANGFLLRWISSKRSVCERLQSLKVLIDDECEDFVIEVKKWPASIDHPRESSVGH